MAIPQRASSLTAFPAARGVILAIDYGKKRLGLALSDEHGVTSRPYATWTRINRRRDLARLRELVRQESVRRIVVGLPLHLDGTQSEMSEEDEELCRARRKSSWYSGGNDGRAAEFLGSAPGAWPPANFNERARSDSSGRSAPKKETPLDEIAAAIILRDYLDRMRSQKRPGSRA